MKGTLCSAVFQCGFVPDVSVFRLVPGATVLKYDTAAKTYSPSVLDCTVAHSGDEGTETLGWDGLEAYGLTVHAERFGLSGQQDRWFPQLTEALEITAASRFGRFDLILRKDNAEIDRVSIGVIADGEQGEPGADAVSVSVSPENITFKANAESVITEVKVTVEAFRGGKRLSYADEEYACTPLGSTSMVSGLRWSGSTEDGVFSYVIGYVKGTNINVRIPFRVTVGEAVFDRAINVTTVFNGLKGERGPYIPTPMLWEDYAGDYEFQSGAEGEERLDIVLRRYKPSDGSADILQPYYCTGKHVKSDSDGQWWSDTKKWEPYTLGTFRFVATDLLLAENARIEFLSGQAIRVGERTVCGYFGAPLSNGVIFFSGADNPDDATFKVYADGTVEASKAHISGNSTFRGFVCKAKTVITKDNYKDYIVRELAIDTPESGQIYQSTLDLEKTGNWIEIDSLPENDDEFTGVLYPPVIRAGVAYTDAYRDYVRQFMGNELLICNYSGRQIGVDNGSNTLSLNTEYGMHLRMTFAPEDYMGNGYVECIKWDATPAYRI